MSIKKHFNRIIERTVETGKESALTDFKLTPPDPESETEIRWDIAQYVNKKGYWVMKYKNMGVWHPVRKIFLKDNSPFFRPGAFDLIAGKPQGGLTDVVWIETKTVAEMKYYMKHRDDIWRGEGLSVKKRKHLFDQMKFQRDIIRAWGCRAIFAGSVRDVAAVICPQDLEWIR